jgi:molecular chaperone IbpA
MTQLALRSLFNALQDTSFPTELYQHTVGFDRLFDDLRRNISYISESAANYPPHNIRKVGENLYALDIAVAGFRQSDLKITVEKQVLCVIGNKPTRGLLESDKLCRLPYESEQEYLYRGLAFRAFDKRIPLVETAEVRTASLEDGILTIMIENVLPEKDRSRSIPISNTPTTATL